MVRPTYTIIRDMASTANAILFVPTHTLCHSITADLITQCAIDINTRGFMGVNVTEEDLQSHVSQLHASPLANPLTRGIGIFYPSMPPSESSLCLQLYLEGVIRVMIVPRDSSWALSVKGNVVIVMGTQYVKSSTPEFGRQTENHSIQEIARMQNHAINPLSSGQFHLFCPAEHRDSCLRFINEGLPLESDLLRGDTLKRWVQDWRKKASIVQKQDAVNMLSFTFLYQRLDNNPAYYEA